MYQIINAKLSVRVNWTLGWTKFHWCWIGRDGMCSSTHNDFTTIYYALLIMYYIRPRLKVTSTGTSKLTPYRQWTSSSRFDREIETLSQLGYTNSTEMNEYQSAKYLPSFWVESETTEWGQSVQKHSGSSPEFKLPLMAYFSSINQIK